MDFIFRIEKAALETMNYGIEHGKIFQIRRFPHFSEKRDFVNSIRSLFPVRRFSNFAPSRVKEEIKGRDTTTSYPRAIKENRMTQRKAII